MSRQVAPAQYNSFEDWLRMEDAVARKESKRGTVTGASLGLKVICEDETWEYIMRKSRTVASGGVVDINLTDCLVCAYWTCPAFWELLRCDFVSSVTLMVDESAGAEIIANLTGMRELYVEKVVLLSRYYAEEMSEESVNIMMKKTPDGCSLDMAGSFGESGVLSVADFLIIERSVRALKHSMSEKEIIHIDLRAYDIGMLVDRVSELALDDRVDIQVHGTFLSVILREMAKLRERRSGLQHRDYAEQVIKSAIGGVGLLRYDRASRGYCLPAKLVGLAGDTAVFDVISPINGSCTDYRRFEVTVTLSHLSVDDVLAKRSGCHVFISERFLSDEVKNGILYKGFPAEKV